MQEFNYVWYITNLPDSFKLTSAANNKTNGYRDAFNSPSYTLNRKVSDLTRWITNLSSDQDVFSDNQPWRCGVHENWLVNPETACDKEILIEATSTAANQKLKINPYFANSYTVDWWDGKSVQKITSSAITHTYTWAGTFTIKLSLTWWANRWTFKNGYNYPLVPTDGTTVTWVKIIYMPSLASWFGESEIDPWDHFFRAFNIRWAITSLPDWSFDTSYITEAGDEFFDQFNREWLLTSLPNWSFNLWNIETVGDYFMWSFNRIWGITNLPDWSFNISNITTVGAYFFNCFNYEWSLVTLPANSFRLSTWLTTAGDYFFSSFN